MSHRWTSQGVVVETEFKGAHLYHLVTAGCILNDVYRESDRLGVSLTAPSFSYSRRVSRSARHRVRCPGCA